MENKKIFRRDINGLRAIAVVTVLMFHFSIPPFSGGFVGVDIFFTISGYLMTEIIASGLARNIFNIPTFYLRRLLRIVPALALLVTVLLAFGSIILLPEAFHRLSTDSAYALSFLINFHFAKDTGYFGDNPNTSWLLHCWSLAVEFQFYIVFPIAAWFTWRIGRKVGLILLLIAVVFVTLPYAYIETARNQMAAFYLLPARAWEFALGGLVALAPLSPRAFSRPLAWLGLVMITIAVFWFNRTWLYPSIWPLLPVVGTAFVIWANATNPVLESDVFQLFGNISYSLYLWHWPIVCVARYSAVIETPLIELIILVMAIMAGWLSSTYIENRFRGRGSNIKLWVFTPLAGASLLICGLGFLMSTDLMSRLRIPAYINELVTASVHTNQFRDNICFLGPDQRFADLAPECVTPKDPIKPSLLIWGDSHAAQLYPGIISQLWSQKFNILQVTASACPPLQLEMVPSRPFCPEIERRGLELIEQVKPYAVLMAGGVLGLEGDPNDARRDVDKAPQLAALIRELREHGVANVYVMGRLPKWSIALPQLVYIRNRTHVESPNNRARIENADSMPSEDRVLRAVTESAGGRYISIGDLNCIKSECLALVPGHWGLALTQFDTEHLTSQGAEWVASRAIGPALGFKPAKRLEVALGEAVTFNEGAKGTQLLTSGWMPPEGWGAWTIYQDRPGVIMVPVTIGIRPRAVRVTFWGQLAPVFPEEHFTMIINRKDRRDMAVTLKQPIRTEIYELTPEEQAQVAATGLLRLEFMAPEGRSSKSMGLNEDERVLGFGIREMRLLE